MGSLKETSGTLRQLTMTNLSLVENGPVAQSLASLEEKGIESVIFTGVEPNPKIENCYEGLKVYQENGCDSIITIGD